MADLIARDGEALIGDPEKLACPHCGAAPTLKEVITPKKGWVLRFWTPPFGCCRQGRRGGDG